MFARRSKLFFGSQVVAETPLLLPSFSSKGFPQVAQIMKLMGEFITSPILVSAYDVYYERINKKITFSELIFLDGGGYEARVEHDLSESYNWPHRAGRWNRRYHEQVLRRWKSKWPTVAVTYDSPTQFHSISHQQKAGRQSQSEHPGFLWEILLKPERKSDRFVPFEKVIKNVHHLHDFAVVGITEKEIDDSLLGAMTKIARLRVEMDTADVRAPIHVFGSLDPITTVLYFVAGAEIFDGLTWLRFGYHEGKTIYHQNYGAVYHADGIRRRMNEQIYEMWKNNYYYLERLRTQMIGFTRSGDFSKFESIAHLVENAHKQLEAVVPQR